MIKPGLLASALLGIVLLAFAVSVDFPKANGGGFKADESTYYVLAHSLTNDLDFQFERKDLIRVWEEFPGPEGIFLKRGKDIEVRGSSSFPFVRWMKHEDPERETRLYFSKSYIYPLVASPFVYVFGTNGFLVFHAILLALDFLVIYLFVQATTKSNWVSLPLTAAFLGVSLVPVYFVWLMPELFNFSFVLYAVFFWAYKEVARDRLGEARSTFLADPASDYVAAALIGVATFSKPPHLLILVPIVLLALSRRQWQHAVATVIVCGAITASLFAANVAITGEFNYQGGDRKTFYSHDGFPFANTYETFDNIGPVRGREDLLVGDVLVNTHSWSVLRHNLWYFFVGRNAGLVPYFFPGGRRTSPVLVVAREATLAVARFRDDRRGRGHARVRLAVHMERWRRTGRQPVLSAVLCAVPRPDSSDCGRRFGNFRVRRRGTFYRAVAPQSFLRLAASRCTLEIRCAAAAPDGADAPSRSACRSRSGPNETPHRTAGGVGIPCAGVFSRRQRLQSRGDASSVQRLVVLGQGQVPGGNCSPRPGRSSRRNRLDHESDHESHDRGTQRRHSEPRDDRFRR